jgi:SynChlorMet cassette radical SAM/SPASM protein ScmF
MYISGSCNLACRHCWISPTYEPDNSKGQFLKLEYVKKAVREAKPLGLQSVKLTGGEPMLHPQFREMIEWLNDENIEIILETNGTLIDKKIANFLKNMVHVRFISVSIDGACANTHDSLRCVPGSFALAVSGIKQLVSHGFNPQLICTLHKGNKREMDSILELAVDIGCGSVKFNIIQDMGRGEDFPVFQKLDIAEIIQLSNKIDELTFQKYPLKILFDIPPAFRSIKNLLFKQSSHCSALNILAVLADGKVSLCGIGTSVPALIYGDVSKQTVKSIWQEATGLKKLRSLIPDHFQGICSECLHHMTCLGTCIAQNYQKTNEINSSHGFCMEAKIRNIFPNKRLFGGENA